MNMYRPAYKITESKPGSDLAGETAAALAAASILFKDSDSAYSDDCLLHARQLYSFADNFRGKYSDSIPDAANFYYSWGVYDDELAWAALWLYRATGEETFLTQAKAHYSNIYTSGVQEFSWAEKTPGAMVLLAQLTDAPEKQTYLQDLEGFCDRIINEKPRTPKGLVFIGKWGSLRYAANVAFVCLRAADLGIKSETYRAFGKQQIHYMLGSTGRSFVVGFGNNPPQRPHHASSSCKDPPEPCSWPDFHSPAPNPHILYGALVGGPGQDDSYVDVRSDYVKNEVACDYNAGFQSAVAALRQLAGCSGSTATTAAPDTTATSMTTRPPGTTQSPVTTKAPTTPGPKPTTDGGGSSSCDLVQQTNEWLGNFQANLIVQVPVTVKSWTITLTFSGVVTQFRVSSMPRIFPCDCLLLFSTCKIANLCVV
uniref:Endoglucanase n=1 Tax=Scylla olivacea TaxID=85551 RepID=A0A0P4WDV2_SCYOL